MPPLRRLFSIFRPGMVADVAAQAPDLLPGVHRALYEGLFCDDLQRFAPAPGAHPTPWQAVLFAPQARAVAVRSLADDVTAESRVRALAYHWLRTNGHEVPARRLLGVVFEVPMGERLDVLAAYADGSVRLLHHAGPPAIFDGPVPALQTAVQQVMEYARLIVARIGPQQGPRRAPSRHKVRMSFVVSDGLHIGEGSMQVMQADPMAGPLLAAGANLLAQVAHMARR